MTGKENKVVLIALLKDKTDFNIAVKKNWYRIPVSTKSVPVNVRNGKINIIAFYLPKIFGKNAYTIKWYSDVLSVSKVKRTDLFPNEPKNEKSQNEYYKIQIKNLKELSPPIISRRARRILFISTNLQRFNSAIEINDLFYESPLEERLWKAFKEENIDAERQYFVNKEDSNYILDFALFCKERKLGIECDGDKYHTEKTAVQSDKHRDNILETLGWSVMRYTTDDIMYNLESSLYQIKEIINNYGGLEIPGKSEYRYLRDENDMQIPLFE